MAVALILDDDNTIMEQYLHTNKITNKVSLGSGLELSNGKIKLKDILDDDVQNLTQEIQNLKNRVTELENYISYLKETYTIEFNDGSTIP
jgi:uncharacterized protein YeeX (DUF496 family)